MLCKDCDYRANEMQAVDCYDDPDEGHAFNLYLCDECGMICKEDVWQDAGKIWIDIEGNVTKDN